MNIVTFSKKNFRWRPSELQIVNQYSAQGPFWDAQIWCRGHSLFRASPYLWNPLYISIVPHLLKVESKNHFLASLVVMDADVSHFCPIRCKWKLLCGDFWESSLKGRLTYSEGTLLFLFPFFFFLPPACKLEKLARALVACS